MIAHDLEVTLHLAFVEARKARHEDLTLEHLLYALLDNPPAADALKAVGVNMALLKADLQEFIAKNVAVLKGTDEVETTPTMGFQRVMQRAVVHVQSSGHEGKEVTGVDVLIAMFGEKDSHAVYFMRKQGIERLDLTQYVSHGIRKTAKSDAGDSPAAAHSSAGEGKSTEGKAETELDKYAQNLNRMAQEGRLDPLIGRGAEVLRTVQVL